MGMAFGSELVTMTIQCTQLSECKRRVKVGSGVSASIALTFTGSKQCLSGRIYLVTMGITLLVLEIPPL